jgi:hypothetical protein
MKMKIKKPHNYSVIFIIIAIILAILAVSLIQESKWNPYLKNLFWGKKNTMTIEEKIAANKQAEINYNIKKSETIRHIQDYPNMEKFYKNNSEYQKYYTLIYPPDTIGQYIYKPQNVANAASNFSKNIPKSYAL